MPRMAHRHCLALLAATLASPVALADALATDRPDFVESSNTVGAGHVQIETSVAYEDDTQSGIDSSTWSTPTLLRIGIGDYWEARVETDGFMDQELDGNGIDQSDSGFADVSVGLKWHLPGSEDCGPSIGFLLHADLETGSDEFKGDGVRPSLRMVAEWELPSDFSFGVMPGVIYDNDEEGERFTAGILGAVLGYAFSDTTRVFGEVAAQQIASNSHGGDIVTFDIGTVHLLSDDSQIDAAASFGLTDETPEWSVTIGYSVRF
jgi:Putative MetA-pathway of phenol degradation